MGVTRLKIKSDLNYRRGYTSRSCRYCNHRVLYKSETEGDVYRCELIGVKPGRLYNINQANICDKYDNSRYLNRLKGQI